MRVLGIIPARGGSKGVPRKNIKMLDGLPLLAYSIQAAKESKLITHFVVASEDDEILTIAKSFISPVFKRIESNSLDDSPVTDVVKEVINDINDNYDLVLLLQPTAPIRTGHDIDNVISLFKNDDSLNNVVSVVELQDIHPARMYTLNNSNQMFSLEKENETKRRQDLAKVYLRNGSIYAVKTSFFLKTGLLMGASKKAYIMPESHWLNIDTERDFLLAEGMIKMWKNGKL
ncbi:acylneuraminate cytidylyltransferase family protein [Lutibacter sp. HS1-25]|uniref:acylneuraminate cytidylyltransferase family protein n=1 Tax=Lutibacter sp. HS1-25 TaxID=2485000 RepID=UPI00101289F9|nr:acylneuraminate cytidylyltransferase family protein [Lutibacter sp. HS1-25]RXP52736.1 acylneuraminate cytidylyltransferase family protein [Lutibacter sp. HS1-25]